MAWLAGRVPLWEERFSEHFPPPPGQEQRRLLRPVYWLGNWQFACLGDYRPPRATRDRCVRAEPFPPVLARLVERIEHRVRARFAPRDVPSGWRLDTCLVNLYGSRLEDGRWIDSARVGEHRDFEPGPVASLSIGERALLHAAPRAATVTAVSACRLLAMDKSAFVRIMGPLHARLREKEAAYAAGSAV